jgi:hypothetical protein
MLHFENSNLFRISIFEFRIFRLRTLLGSGYAGLGSGITPACLLPPTKQIILLLKDASLNQDVYRGHRTLRRDN